MSKTDAQKVLTITLRRGLSGHPPDQVQTLRGLGLRKIRQTVVRRDTPEIRGMVRKVIHLVDVQEK
jgi:large subunit ribosomal protein L30